MIPTSTANQSVTTRTIKVVVTAMLFAVPFLIKRNVKEPSVTPNPPGSIETAPIIVAKA